MTTTPDHLPLPAPGSKPGGLSLPHGVFGNVDAEAVAYDAASDGCFPFITNEALPAAELLRIYKTQPHLERRHATFGSGS